MSNCHRAAGFTCKWVWQKPSPPASALLSSNSVMDKLGLCLCVHSSGGHTAVLTLQGPVPVQPLITGEPVGSHCVRGTPAILNSYWALFLTDIFSSLGRLLRKMIFFFFSPRKQRHPLLVPGLYITFITLFIRGTQHTFVGRMNIRKKRIDTCYEYIRLQALHWVSFVLDVFDRPYDF